MAARKNKTPDFFNDELFDPVEIATGSDQSDATSGPRGVDKSQVHGPEGSARTGPGSKAGPKTHVGPGVNKKKAGFYLSVDLLDRFARKFYELKLAGAAIENKSALLELALSFALDDLDRGAKSHILKNFELQ